MRCNTSCTPSSGLRIHCQTSPVATNDIAYGYRNTVRSAPSATTRWSMKIASSNPITMHATIKHAPYTTMFCNETIQRSFSNSRTYCVTPAKPPDGNVREKLSETRAVHSIVPRYANSTVSAIGSSATHAAHGRRRPSGFGPRWIVTLLMARSTSALQRTGECLLRIVDGFVLVPEVRDHVRQRALQVGRNQHFRVRQLTRLVLHDRDAFLRAKGDLCGRRGHHRREQLLRLDRVRVVGFREHEHVARHHVRRMRTEAREAAEVLARHLVRRRELALRPVAH